MLLYIYCPKINYIFRDIILSLKKGCLENELLDFLLEHYDLGKHIFSYLGFVSYSFDALMASSLWTLNPRFIILITKDG